jgi:hypothetical protein
LNLNSSPFANIGWSGWIGSIQGYSSTQMAISEIGVSYPDDTFGKESRFGTPFTVLYLVFYSTKDLISPFFALIVSIKRCFTIR